MTKSDANLLASAIRGGSLATILFDNSTMHHAIEILGEYGPRQRVMPGNRKVAWQALAEFVNAVVLHERLLVGPERDSTSYGANDLADAKDLVKSVTDEIGWDQTYEILKLSYARATDVYLADPALHGVLEGAVGVRLDCELVEQNLREIRPEYADHSPHLHVSGHNLSVDAYCIGMMGYGSVAMNSADPKVAGRFLGTSDYFQYFAKRGGVGFPENGLQEYYAAHLLFRVLAYLDLSEILDCVYRADAVRSDIVTHFAGNGRLMRKSFGEILVQHVDGEEKKRDGVVNQVLGYEQFKVTVPLVLHAILNRTRRRDEVLRVALDMRESKAARRFRSFCGVVDEAIAAGNRKEVERAIQELSAYGLRLTDDIRGEANLRLDVTQDLVSYASPLLAALIPLIKAPVDRLYRLARFRKFAFLDQLREVPRAVQFLEPRLLRLKWRK